MGLTMERWAPKNPDGTDLEKICPPLRGQSACELARIVSKLLLVAAASVGGRSVMNERPQLVETRNGRGGDPGTRTEVAKLRGFL
jgi:hypothetical protein